MANKVAQVAIAVSSALEVLWRRLGLLSFKSAAPVGRTAQQKARSLLDSCLSHVLERSPVCQNSLGSPP